MRSYSIGMRISLGIVGLEASPVGKHTRYFMVEKKKKKKRSKYKIMLLIIASVF